MTFTKSAASKKAANGVSPREKQRIHRSQPIENPNLHPQRFLLLSWKFFPPKCSLPIKIFTHTLCKDLICVSVREKIIGDQFTSF
jgi:hypothetical protein